MAGGFSLNLGNWEIANPYPTWRKVYCALDIVLGHERREGF